MRTSACAIFHVFLLKFYFLFLPPTEPISYGRTQQRYITKDKDFLSYPSSAIVTVLAKGAYFGENGEEFWEAEVRNFYAAASTILILEAI